MLEDSGADSVLERKKLQHRRSDSNYDSVQMYLREIEALVDGRPLDGNRWTPQGTGEARVAVVDEAGHSSAVTVRIVRRP